MNVFAKYYWANLEQLYLSTTSLYSARNNIGAEGIKMLVKSHTPKLKVLILSIIYFMFSKMQDWR